MANEKKKPARRTGGTRRRKAAPPANVVPLPVPGMDAFMTRAKANEGHRIPLHAADGKLTAHWVQVRGIDSDAFRQAETTQKRRLKEFMQIKDEGEREAAVAEGTLILQASLVADWSFADADIMAKGGNSAIPCTLENVVNFLREAPQIASKIDELASRRTFFFKTPTGSLMPSQPQSSD